MRTLICMLLTMMFLAGCASSKMTSKKTLADGTVIEYGVSISSLGQDFKGSDLSAELNPEGKTTVKAGQVDNTMSPVTADVAKAMVEAFTLFLEYMKTQTATPVP